MLFDPSKGKKRNYLATSGSTSLLIDFVDRQTCFLGHLSEIFCAELPVIFSWYDFCVSKSSHVIKWGEELLFWLLISMCNVLIWYKCFEKELEQHKKILLKYKSCKWLVKISICTLTWIISNIEKAFGEDKKFHKSLSGLLRVISDRKNSFVLTMCDSQSLGYDNTFLCF